MHPRTLILAVAVAVAVAASALSFAPAAAPAAAKPAIAASGEVSPVIAARGARGFGRSRTRTTRRPVTRNRARGNRNLGRSILRALGIAWLVSFLFGWGSGGSPFGLLLLLALAFLLVRAFRPRPRAW